MTLTAKQEAFCQAVANGMTQAEAYRTNYDIDPNCKPETIWVNASQLMADTNVSQRVATLKDEIAAKALWTREDSVRTLKSVIDGNDKGSEITGAVKVLNDMHGYNAPKEITVNGSLNLNVQFD